MVYKKKKLYCKFEIGWKYLCGAAGSQKKKWAWAFNKNTLLRLFHSMNGP